MPGKNRKYKKYNKTKTTKVVDAAPKTKSGIVSLIKSVTMKDSETKYKSRNLDYGAMVHNGIHKIPIWDADALIGATSILPEQGINDATRIGDRIHALKIKLRMALDIPWDRKNCKVKVYFLEYNSDQGDPTSFGDFFHTVTGKSRLDPIQVKRWGRGLKYLGDYQPLDRNASYTYIGSSAPAASNTATNTATIYIKRDIVMNKKVFFKSDGAMTPASLKENGCLLFLPYASNNTTGSDNIVLTAKGASTLYFKDL